MASATAFPPSIERRAPSAQRPLEARKHLREALSLLLEAYEYAQELSLDPWSFAVELSVLRAAKLSHSDIRWLSMMRYIEHASETTNFEDEERNFRRTGPVLFADRTCFVCTAEGAAVARRMCGKPIEERMALPAIPVQRPLLPPAAVESAPVAALPEWDYQRRQIRVGDCVVKEFKLPAPNQETILTAFEEEGWPPRIDDPLPPIPEIDPRRRLHDTIKALNRKQRHPLLRFMGDGNGQGIRWELRTARHRDVESDLEDRLEEALAAASAGDP